MMSPMASSRPATPGSSASGSQTQTNACCGSEVIVDLRRLAHSLRQDRETVLDATRLQGGGSPIIGEQRDLSDGGSLEGGPQADGRVPPLDLLQRRLRDADAVGEFLERPESLASRQANMGAQTACSLDCQGR